MPQEPILVDAISIAPGEVGTRTIDRDPSDGSIRIVDPANPSGVKVCDLAGMRSIENVFVVGKDGCGAQYNTIQDALDAVPATSSLTAPSLVFVLPGVYSEQVTIEKDGVWLYSPGGAVIDAPAAGATLVVQSSVSSTPNFLRLQNLRINNDYDGEPCINLVGGALSTIGSIEVGVYDCDLVATGAGGFQIRANTVNAVRVQGGTWGGHATSLARITQCHRFSLRNVDQVVSLQMDYDTGNPAPSLTGSEYVVSGVAQTGNTLSTLVGAGSLTMGSLLGGGNLTVGGDVGFAAVGCEFGDVVVNDTAALRLRGCARSATIAGAGTLEEDFQEGTISFAASASEAVVFPVDHPDSDYRVVYETELTEPIATTSPTASGFTTTFASPQTTTVKYMILRRM